MKNITLKSLILFFGFVTVAHAEVIRDGSVGSDTNLNPEGPNYVINENMGKLSGNNLFHSFSKFNLNSSESATFTATNPVNNVINRITDSNPSSIDGQINSDITGANFYFINPNGVIFGENASINIDGSFHVSTGNYLLFSDGRFAVSLNDNSSILSAEPPMAFGFLNGSTPGSIQINESNIELKEQSQLSLVAGDVTLTSSENAIITVPGGQVKIVSVASEGEVPIAFNDNTLTTQALGNVIMNGDASQMVEVDDDAIDDAPNPSINLNGDTGGSISIRSQQLSVNNFSIATHTLGDNDSTAIGIDFDINESFSLSGNSHLSSTSEGAGQAGNIHIKAQAITMQEDAEILSDTFSTAKGGQVNLEASTIRLSGDAELGSDVEGSGDGGEVNITADTLIISDEAEISSDSAGTGDGGNISITASNNVLIERQGGVFADTQGEANAGNIVINTPTLIVRGFEEEDDDDDDDDEFESEVDDDLFEAAGIFTLSNGFGNAGDITINSNRVEIREEATIAASAISANGGNIDITSDDRLIVTGSAITANVSQGTGGNIELSSGLVIVHDSEIVAQAGAGKGGEINVITDQFFSSEALISASAGPEGIPGTVTTPTAIDLTSTLTPVDTDFLDINSIFNTECKVRGNIEKQGSLVVLPEPIKPTSREGLLVPTKSVDHDEEIPYAPQFADSSKTVTIQNSMDDIGQILLSIAQIRQQKNNKENAFIEAEKKLKQLPTSNKKVYAQLYLANSYSQTQSNRDRYLLKANELMRQAEKMAITLNDQRALSYVYGNLALLYYAENRIDEALYLTQQASQIASVREAIDARYRWFWLEAKLLWAKGLAKPAINTYKKAIKILSKAKLETTVPTSLSKTYFEQEIEPVYLELVDVLFKSADLLKNDQQALPLLLMARATLEQFKVAELRDYFNDPCITEVTQKTTQLDQLIDSAAIIYPISLPDRLELLVSLPEGLQRFTIAKTRDELSHAVDRFRSDLQKINSLLYRKQARSLYQWLIQPIEGTLKKQNVSTLVFVPGPILRSLPFSALYDGDKFLVEKFALATAPSLSLIDPKPINKQETRLLLAGLSQEVQGYSGLSSVVEEIDYIEKLYGKANSNVLLNQEFVSKNVKQKLESNQPNIVHIASHAKFTGQSKENFILTHDAQMDMSQLGNYIGVAKYRERPLELLILSACETASGDERAVLGLAGASIQAGARSVLGSLWKIDDQATLKMMTGFYSGLNRVDNSKATALQKAQLQMLNTEEYGHPYYWSAFLIINNWL